MTKAQMQTEINNLKRVIDDYEEKMRVNVYMDHYEFTRLNEVDSKSKEIERIILKIQDQNQSLLDVITTMNNGVLKDLSQSILNLTVTNN